MKISKDLFFTGINQFWKIISGPVVLIFIPLFLTPETQGYWFTFISISALSIFADLGFTNIVLQFSAHEFAYLNFDENFVASGSDIHLKRLSSFFKFTIKWALIMAVIAFPFILMTGCVIFSRKNDSVSWLLPWIFYVTGSGINFFNNTLLAFFEGCNQVARVQRIRFEIALVNTFIMLSMLYCGAGLYAISTAMFISSMLIFLYLSKIFGKFIRQMLMVSKNFIYSWRHEFLKLFWKYALSWASGYFIFQIYTPLMFHFHGAVEAGKIGITMALWTAAFSISNVWIYSVTPRINMHVSKKEWFALDNLFKKRLILSVATFIAGVIFFFCLYIFIKDRIDILNRIFSRFMSIIPLICLALAWLLQLVVNSLAVYLRAHKEEPFVLPSIVGALYIFITTFLCTSYFKSDFIFLGFLSSFIFIIPWSMLIFYKKRKLWHK